MLYMCIIKQARILYRCVGMARVSRDLDKKLLIVGQALIEEVGVSKFSLREVARIANVNLGMINYYFEGKEDFVLKVLQEIYRPFLEELERLSNQAADQLGFENFLFELAKFSRDNRKLILILIKDIISNDPTVKQFILTHFTSHFNLLQKALEAKVGPNKNSGAILRFVIASIGMPNLILGFQEIILSSAQDLVAETDDELKKRVLITIEGLNRYIKES